MNATLNRAVVVTTASVGLVASVAMGAEGPDGPNEDGAINASEKALWSDSRVAVGYRITPVELVAPNITPDEHGRPAGLTFEQFEHLMRTGRDDERILQVMPWNVYSKMTRLDLRAIYEYLRAVPALPNNTNPAL